jgi:hypothetical protein
VHSRTSKRLSQAVKTETLPAPARRAPRFSLDFEVPLTSMALLVAGDLSMPREISCIDVLDCSRRCLDGPERQAIGDLMGAGQRPRSSPHPSSQHLHIGSTRCEAALPRSGIFDISSITGNLLLVHHNINFAIFDNAFRACFWHFPF